MVVLLSAFARTITATSRLGNSRRCASALHMGADPLHMGADPLCDSTLHVSATGRERRRVSVAAGMQSQWIA